MKGDFIKEIAEALNRDNWDSRLNMPDFVIAEMLHDMLMTLLKAKEKEEIWRNPEKMREG